MRSENKLEKTSFEIETGLASILNKKGIPFTINRCGSMFTVFFCEGPVRNLGDAKNSDTKTFARFFNGMLNAGVYMAPSQFEAVFVSAAL